MRLWCAALGFGCWVRSQPGFSWFCVFLLIGLLPCLVPEKRWKKGKKICWGLKFGKCCYYHLHWSYFFFGIDVRVFRCVNVLTGMLLWNLGFIAFPFFYFVKSGFTLFNCWEKVGKEMETKLLRHKVWKMLTYHVWAKCLTGMSFVFVFFLVLFLFKLWVYLFALARNDGKMWFLQPILIILFYLLMWEKFIGAKQYKIIK